MPKGVFLAFDFGTKRIGLAIGQTITQTATPLIAIHSDNGIPHWAQLDKIMQEWEPSAFVVGLALQPDGTDSPSSLKAKQLGKRLQKKYNLPVHYVEERLTSVAAKEWADQHPHAERDLDAIAAAVILESWMYTQCATY
jgi:putative Holliday junction resolvase